MTKIVVTNPMGLSEEQKGRLQLLGEVKFYDTMPASPDEWLERVKGFDVICSMMNGLRENYSKLKNVFVSVPFVAVNSFADPAIVKKNNITISNSPGCNRHAVSEWIVYMLLTVSRQINKYINTRNKLTVPLPYGKIGLAGKRITILGHGNVGKRVGAVCEAFEMKVNFFRRGDNLPDAVKNTDIVVDVMSVTPESKGLLNKTFFDSLKKGCVFISITVDAIEDFDAMLKALDEGRLSYVAHDVMNAPPADTSNPIYKKLSSHPKVFATPHISFMTDVSTKIDNDMMIANIEAWSGGKPINVFGT